MMVRMVAVVAWMNMVTVWYVLGRILCDVEARGGSYLGTPGEIVFLIKAVEGLVECLVPELMMIRNILS